MTRERITRARRLLVSLLDLLLLGVRELGRDLLNFFLGSHFESGWCGVCERVSKCDHRSTIPTPEKRKSGMRYSEYRNYCICMGIFLSIYGYFLEILSSFILHDQLDWSNCHIH